MLSKILPRLKRKKTETLPENIVCANCETQFDGHFCPNCGQSIKEYDKPINFVIYNFLGDLFAFDTRFFKTILALLFKPGFLSKEYIAGRRVRYAPPFRIFVFVSFVLFLLLQIYTNRGLTSVLDTDFNDGIVKLDSNSVAAADSVYTRMRTEMDSTEVHTADSLLTKLGVKTKRAGVTGKLGPESDIGTGIDIGALVGNTRNTNELLNKVINTLEEDLKTEEDPDKRARLQKFIRICRSPVQANAKILQYISYAFFLLLPILAIILKMVYIRRNQNYIRHLVFSIHIHAFIFVVLTLVVGLMMVSSGGSQAIVFGLLLLVPVYFIIAMKKFYGQTVGKTIVKALLVSFTYNIIFLTGVILAAFNALNML
ncbi:DUF3667 domain-containing protein [Prolixibacteraceae bacterium Z1-6]|uniref:DUF3667 domain-containing protein n=1 Tax=Draconibacterium aestuarii TaxID=2998507 RepID=A0A9X3FFA6_9BACT|nr:DUF3667 domain-containing protein [Prolixibacteraceae bacterium Z1-6]